jgi:two-component system LytT family response regulator
MHLEAAGSYTWFYIKDSKKELVAKNLKDFEDILPPTVFCRIHHSHIVNINFVKKYFKGRGGYVEMEDGTTVEVSARKKEDFLKRYMG